MNMFDVSTLWVFGMGPFQYVVPYIPSLLLSMSGNGVLVCVCSMLNKNKIKENHTPNVCGDSILCEIPVQSQWSLICRKVLYVCKCAWKWYVIWSNMLFFQPTVYVWVIVSTSNIINRLFKCSGHTSTLDYEGLAISLKMSIQFKWLLTSRKNTLAKWISKLFGFYGLCLLCRWNKTNA